MSSKNNFAVIRSAIGKSALHSPQEQAIEKKDGSSKRARTDGGLMVSNNYDTRSVGDTSLQNAARIIELQSYVVGRIDQLKKSHAVVRKLTQLAAFIPDYILQEEGTHKIPYQSSRDAVVLMVDVSGFTALTEAYSLKGKGGTDQLTKTLMSYIGPLAECILLTEGDIVKYAGDAFLAFWTTNPDDYPEDVQRVIDCALYIQEKYGSYLCKEVDITIRVKIGIGAGLVHLSWIGNDSYQHYVCFGPGVEAASASEKHCNSGEVVLHPKTWMYCNPANYKVTVKDDVYRVVTNIVTFLNPEKRGRPRKMPHRRSFQNQMDSSKKPAEEIVIRPVIAECIEKKSEEFMRKFIISPVLKKLDDEIPLEYLNESRNICISFIHMDTVPMSHEGIAFRETMTQVVNKAFVKVYTSVTKLQGALTKVIMFDKGLTYLVVFGLPGFITENQCAHALKFSDTVRRQLLAIPYVNEVSIGVTTGSCYTGVLGHPRRQEYTVMGRKVNKAARLMIHYPDRVACDQDTAYHSKLPQSCFELQEYKELKGIANPGKIYEYVNNDNTEDQSVAIFPYPMVGRDAEMRFFKDVLQKCIRDLAEYTKISFLGKGMGKDNILASAIWMIVFEGENGIGKSRMLASCMREADKCNVRIFSVAMNLILSGQALFGLSALIMEALGISDFRTSQEREDFLRKHIKDTEIQSELCVLNEILHVKFPLSAKYAALDVNASQSYGQRVLSTLLRTMYADEMIMFVIDDAHLLDALSWEYFINLAKTPNVFVLAAIRRNAAGSPKLPEVISAQLYHNKNIKVVRLNGLDPTHCLTMSCQMMEVAGIPQDLEKILMTKSQGVPAWCDQVLHELLRTGVLKYSTSTKKAPMSFVDKVFLDKLESTKRRTQNAWLKNAPSDSNADIRTAESSALIRRGSGPGISSQTPDVDPRTRVLIVKSGTNILGHEIHGTLHEILLDSYDELNSNEQIILKVASTLGRKFSKQMVTKILPFYELNIKKYQNGFNHLMEARYIRCASGMHSKASSKDQTSAPECFCKTGPTDSTTKDQQPSQSKGRIKSVSKTPKYWTCKFMEFVKESLVEVVYDLMTEDLRKDFHLKAAKYLDSSMVRCESCGGGNAAYNFGIVLKTGELGMLDNGTALRTAARRTSTLHDETHKTSNSRFGRKVRTSITTQISSIKKTLTNSGTKVAQIEYEILDLLRRIDHKAKKGFRLCKGKSNSEEAEKFLKEELHLLRDDGDKNIVNLKASSGGDNDQTGSCSKGQSGDMNPSTQSVDLRLCECAALQAKVCIEMVKHYREAQKYGKCLINLLDAAESVVTIGNGTQGLVHLEDATGLMRAIRKGELPSPDKDDPDDAEINRTEAEGQIEYLSGLAYFEIGVPIKAKDFFIKALARLGLVLSADENRLNKEASILKAKSQMWRSHIFGCLCFLKDKGKSSSPVEEVWTKKLKILSYLHAIYKQDRKLEMALLVAMHEVIIAEQYGQVMQDVIPAYCNMMDTHTAMNHHKDAVRFEKLSLGIIRDAFGSNEQLEPVGLLTTAHLFYVIANGRLCRGEIDSSTDAAYLGLRIAQTVHDNNLIIRLLPSLTISLLMGLRISEVVEALQKMWYISEEEEDYSGIAMYYTLCLDLLLNTAYPVENFATCEHYVISNDWGTDSTMFRDFEIQYCMEASLALWYTRYSRWESATKWFQTAEAHKPKLSTLLSVSAELKLLECQLIFVNHYLDGKRYQHFAKARNSAKALMRTLTKSIKVIPVKKPRLLHLIAYYYRIRSRNVESNNQLKLAEKAALKLGDKLEVEWIAHNRIVWNDLAIPTVKFFWLEHTENHVLDWHSSGNVRWANIMYSLPLPFWK